MFYSRKNQPKSKPVNAGRKEKNTYSIKLDDRGHKSIRKSGKTDLYAKIQEPAESCKIENIIKRFNAGDITAINQVQGKFENITGMPKTLAEAHRMITDIENGFNELPIEIRREYDHSSEKFIADFGTEHWHNLFDKKPETITEIVGGAENE